MRFNERVKLIYEQKGGYNPETGKNDPPIKKETIKPCNISTLKMDRQQQIFGTTDRLIIVVRLQRPYTSAVSRAEVTTGMYKGNYGVLTTSNYRKGALYLERTKDDGS